MKFKRVTHIRYLEMREPVTSCSLYEILRRGRKVIEIKRYLLEDGSIPLLSDYYIL